MEGDPHYHTFDKQLHNFMGTCTYTLSKLCEGNSSLPYFNVEAANEHRGGNTRVSYVRYVDVDVADQRIRLGQGGVVTVSSRGRLWGCARGDNCAKWAAPTLSRFLSFQVNGVAEILPCSPSAGVQVLSSGFYTMVMTDFGLRVKFDGKHRVEVTLPSTFGQKVCGMCGNYNGMAADDFQNPEGAMEPDSTSLGNSWEVSNNSRWVWPPAAPGTRWAREGGGGTRRSPQMTRSPSACLSTAAQPDLCPPQPAMRPTSNSLAAATSVGSSLTPAARFRCATLC